MVLSARFNIDFLHSWSARVMNRFSFKYGSSIDADHAIASHSLWVVSYFGLGLVGDLDQNLVSLVWCISLLL